MKTSSLKSSIDLIASSELSNLNVAGIKKIRVLMLGPSLSQQGGMASVENIIVYGMIPAIEISHVSTHADVSVLRRLWIFQAALGQTISRLLKNEFDLIHVQVSERASVFRAGVWILLARLFRKPAIIHSHGCEFHTFYESLPRFAQRLVNRIFQQYDCCLTLSQSWRDYYTVRCELVPERVVVLVNPVNLPDQIPDRKGSEVVNFVCLGRIGQRKGSFDLLQAFSHLTLQQQQRSRLILAGDGEIEEALRLADNLGIAEYVKCPGWLSLDECRSLLAKSDVFVLPSYNEGLPMAILEAMSWGLPVISTPVGGIPEVVISRKNGFLVDPGNIQGLTNAMQLLMEDEELRLTLGSASRLQVAPFNVNDYRSRLACIYRESQESYNRLPDTKTLTQPMLGFLDQAPSQVGPKNIATDREIL